MSVKTFTLRLNEQQLEYVSEQADRLGITKNEYIRQLINDDIKEDKLDRILEELRAIREGLNRTRGMHDKRIEEIKK